VGDGGLHMVVVAPLPIDSLALVTLPELTAPGLDTGRKKVEDAGLFNTLKFTVTDETTGEGLDFLKELIEVEDFLELLEGVL